MNKSIETSAHFENIEQEIKRCLSFAKESVYICVAWMSSDVYGEELKSLSKRGIKIKLIYNDDHINKSLNILEDIDGLELYPLKSRLSGTYMHNKFCIIDEETVISGSYNWSANARRSFENILLIKNDFRLVRKYIEEFHALTKYVIAFNKSEIKKCKCGSIKFKLGILGEERGIYNNSEVTIWEICVKNLHTQLISTEHMQNLQGMLGLIDAPLSDSNEDYSKYDMQNDLDISQQQEMNIDSYFTSHRGHSLDCVGNVSIDNHNEYYERGEPAEYVINISIKKTYYRKIIPNKIDINDIDKETNQILDYHC